MPAFSTLKAKIVTICENNALINQVFNYDVPRFDKTPACTIVPSGNASDYETNVHNMRTYAFVITIYIPWDAHGSSGAESTLMAIVDSLVDDFDDDFTLSGSANGGCLATPSAWGYQEREKLYRTAEINLQCKATYQLT